MGLTVSTFPVMRNSAVWNEVALREQYDRPRSQFLRMSFIKSPGAHLPSVRSNFNRFSCSIVRMSSSKFSIGESVSLPGSPGESRKSGVITAFINGWFTVTLTDGSVVKKRGKELESQGSPASLPQTPSPPPVHSAESVVSAKPVAKRSAKAVNSASPPRIDAESTSTVTPRRTVKPRSAPAAGSEADTTIGEPSPDKARPPAATATSAGLASPAAAASPAAPVPAPAATGKPAPKRVGKRPPASRASPSYEPVGSGLYGMPLRPVDSATSPAPPAPLSTGAPLRPAAAAAAEILGDAGGTATATPGPARPSASSLDQRVAGPGPVDAAAEAPAPEAGPTPAYGDTEAGAGVGAEIMRRLGDIVRRFGDKYDV